MVWNWVFRCKDSSKWLWTPDPADNPYYHYEPITTQIQRWYIGRSPVYFSMPFLVWYQKKTKLRFACMISWIVMSNMLSWQNKVKCCFFHSVKLLWETANILCRYMSMISNMWVMLLKTKKKLYNETEKKWPELTEDYISDLKL